jgi:flagellar basal body-associated protein FliL
MKALKIIAMAIVLALAAFATYVLFLWAMNEPIAEQPVKPASARPAACWRAV